MVILACSHAVVPPVPATAVCVIIDGCLGDAGPALPAQLLACGVSEIQVCDCPERPDATAERQASWQRGRRARSGRCRPP